MTERIDDFSVMMQTGIDSAFKHVHTMLPAVIDSFDSSSQRAVVKVAYSMELTDGTRLAYPPLLDVPVQFPRWGSFSITMPVSVGDECAVCFSERALDRFKEEGASEYPPLSARRFDLSDGFAVMGLFSSGNEVSDFQTDAIELKATDSGAVIRITDAGKVSIENSSEELIALLVEVLGVLESDGVTIASGSSAGTYPLDGAASYTALKTRLETFKI